MTIQDTDKNELKSMMRAFEDLSPKKQGYIQGFLAGIETAERGKEDDKDEDRSDKG